MNWKAMVPDLRIFHRIVPGLGLLVLALMCSAQAQTCYVGPEIDGITAKAVESAAQQYFNMSAQGDVAGLRTNAIPEIAGNFAGIEQAVVSNRLYFAEGQPSEARIFVLDASESKTALPQAEFYCGIYNSADRVGFSIPNLPPGRYAISIAKVTGQHPITLTLILQDTAKNSWKLAGYYARLNSVGEHDGQWFLSKAREYKEKGHRFNAWFYYLTAWDLIAPVDFMGTPQLDKLSDEIQAARPAERKQAAGTGRGREDIQGHRHGGGPGAGQSGCAGAIRDPRRCQCNAGSTRQRRREQGAAGETSRVAGRVWRGDCTGDGQRWPYLYDAYADERSEVKYEGDSAFVARSRGGEFVTI
jgi:hypothetical protein